jgi:DNA-binding NarL/FixJ family response regulator
MSDEPVRVLIVDDQQPFRYIAAAVVARTAGFVLAGVAETGEDAVLAAARLRPALVLMDVRLPGIDGVEAARRIVTADPDVAVLLCSTYQINDLPAEVAAAGFAGYFHKASLRPELLRSLWTRTRTSP